LEIKEKMDVDQILAKVLSGKMKLSDVKALVEKVKSEYHCPVLTPETIDEYSDWEIRANALAKNLSELTQSTFELANRNIEHALLTAQVINILAELLGGSNTPDKFLLGYLHWKAGNYFDASELLAEAADGYRQMGDSLLEVTALSYHSDALHKTKELDAALAASDHLIKRATEFNLKGHIASALRDKGEILTDLGREKEAFDCLRMAVEVRRTLSTKEEREHAVASLTAFINLLGLGARRFGHFEGAILAFLEVADLEKKAGNLDLYARAISEVGYTYIQAGEEQRGFEYLEEASRVAESAGAFEDANRWRTQVEMRRREESKREKVLISDLIAEKVKTGEEAYWQSTLAEKFAREGRYAESLKAARVALEWAQMAKDFDLEISTRNVIAKVFNDQGKLEEAINETRRAILVADRVSNKPAMLLLRGNLANALVRQHKYQAADAVLTDGIVRSQLLLAETEASEFRQSIMAGTIWLYEQYASLLSQSEYHDELLRITELARARNLLGWIKAESYLESLTVAADIENEISKVLQELRAVEVELELRHIMKKLDVHSINILKTRRQTCWMQIEEWSHKFGLSGVPWDTKIMDQDYSDMDNLLGELLQHSSAILCLFSVSEGICALLLSRHHDNSISKKSKFIPWDRHERLKSLAQWTGDSSFARGMGKLTLAYREHPDCKSRLESYLETFRRNLLDGLVSLISQCDATRVAIIPHQELVLVPYWDLLDHCSGIMCVTIAPSVRILGLCQRHQRQIRGKTLLVQDPTGTLDLVPWELMFVRQARKDDRIFEPESIEDMEQQASQCTLIHLATHGRFNTENPYHSGVVVNEEVNADIFGYNENGWRLLTVAEIMAKFSLSKCRLAVLSACETGITRLHGGGEMTGLPASLLVAGTKSVIASLWPVDDVATALLMDMFYSQWQGGSGQEPSPAIALAKARLALSTLTREDILCRLGNEVENIIPNCTYPFSHPFYTNAFQCYGSW